MELGKEKENLSRKVNESKYDNHEGDNSTQLDSIKSDIEAKNKIKEGLITQFQNNYNDFVEYRDIVTRLLRLARIPNWNEDNAFGSLQVVNNMLDDLATAVKNKN